MLPEPNSILLSITSGISALNQLRKSGGALVNFSHTGDKSLLKVHNEIHAQNVNIHIGNHDLHGPGTSHSLSSVPTAGALERSGAGSLAAETPAALRQAAPTGYNLTSGPQDDRPARPAS